VNCSGDLNAQGFQDRPTIRWQLDERKSTPREVLLIAQIFVGQEEHIKFGFGARDKVRRFQCRTNRALEPWRPGHPEKTGAEEPAHFRRTGSSRRLAPHQSEKFLDILATDGGKEFDELLNRESVVQVVQERLHRNSRTVKYDHASQDVGVRRNRTSYSTHDLILGRQMAPSNSFRAKLDQATSHRVY
jgi:hypothetical protein